MQTVAHPWHIPIGDNAPDIVRAVIEIPKGNRMKYELEKQSGLLGLNRVLYSSFYYPMNYGLIPQTYFEDNDPLDILVMCSFPIEPLCIVDAKIIGIMHMQDNDETDDKIISVALNDPTYKHINDISDVPQHHMNELKHFFAEYKSLENKKVIVSDMFGKEKAKECVLRSMSKYREKFNSMNI